MPNVPPRTWLYVAIVAAIFFVAYQFAQSNMLGKTDAAVTTIPVEPAAEDAAEAE